jgi:uncharacterized protein (TIGR02246 family)
MPRITAGCFGFLLACLSALACAGPIEEVTQIAASRGQAFQDGNAEAYTAAFADNVVFQSSFSAFRIEGKEAVKAYFTELFLLYPRRHLFIRQPTMRAYNDDLVMQDGYAVLSLLNERGDPKVFETRYSLTWAKVGGRWQIVDQHVSRLPTTQ